MSVFGDALDVIRDVILLRKEVTDLSIDLRELVAKHSDTRERVIRIEALIEASMARRLGR